MRVFFRFRISSLSPLGEGKAYLSRSLAICGKGFDCCAEYLYLGRFVYACIDITAPLNQQKVVLSLTLTAVHSYNTFVTLDLHLTFSLTFSLFIEPGI